MPQLAVYGVHHRRTYIYILGYPRDAPDGWGYGIPERRCTSSKTMLQLPLSFGGCDPRDHKKMCPVLGCRARLISWSGTRTKTRVSRSEHLRAFLSPSMGDLLVACMVTTPCVPKRDKLDQTTRRTGWSLLLRLSRCRTDVASCLDDVVGRWQAGRPR